MLQIIYQRQQNKQLKLQYRTAFSRTAWNHAQRFHLPPRFDIRMPTWAIKKTWRGCPFWSKNPPGAPTPWFYTLFFRIWSSHCIYVRGCSKAPASSLANGQRRADLSPGPPLKVWSSASPVGRSSFGAVQISLHFITSVFDKFFDRASCCQNRA